MNVAARYDPAVVERGASNYGADEIRPLVSP